MRFSEGLTLALKKTCLACLILAISGCASAYKGPLRLYPAEIKTDEYYSNSREITFENKSVRIAVKALKQGENETGVTLIDDLMDDNYVLLRMDIENHAASKLKVIYNPAYTVFTDDSMDYRKPLDYTDLYDLAKDETEMETGVRKLRGRFYDLALTLAPGESVSKLLIFSPISENSRNAELVIGELYIGTKTIKVSFPFVLKKDDK